jgi:hypothetical protein
MTAADSRPPSRNEHDTEAESDPANPTFNSPLPPATVNPAALAHLTLAPNTPTPWNPEEVTSPTPLSRFTDEEIESFDKRTLRGIILALSRQADKPDVYKRPSKRDDFFGQLKWVKSALDNAPKLNTKNWYAWNPRFLSALGTWKDAVRHLEGTVKPGDDRFDEVLDDHLETILEGTCEVNGTNSVNFMLTRPRDSQPWTFHGLYEKLKSSLLKLDGLNKATLLREAGNIRMYNSDVRKLVDAIRNHWAKADVMGHPLDQQLKIQTLLTSARYNGSYANCIDILEDTGNADDFDSIAASLFKRNDRLLQRPTHRIAGPTAPTGSIRMAEGLQAEAYPDSYWNGRPGPNGETPKCYNCYQTGHISKKCPKPQRPRTDANNPAHDSPSA